MRELYENHLSSKCKLRGLRSLTLAHPRTVRRTINRRRRRRTAPARHYISCILSSVGGLCMADCRRRRAHVWNTSGRGASRGPSAGFCSRPARDGGRSLRINDAFTLCKCRVCTVQMTCLHRASAASAARHRNGSSIYICICAGGVCRSRVRRLCAGGVCAGEVTTVVVFLSPCRFSRRIVFRTLLSCGSSGRGSTGSIRVVVRCFVRAFACRFVSAGSAA